jgi:hypothetical protein
MTWEHQPQAYRWVPDLDPVPLAEEGTDREGLRTGLRRLYEDGQAMVGSQSTLDLLMAAQRP